MASLVLTLASVLVSIFDCIYSFCLSNFRYLSSGADFSTVHAKGVLLKGTFTPSAEASKLSIAQHFNQPSTPILARFSNGKQTAISP